MHEHYNYIRIIGAYSDKQVGLLNVGITYKNIELVHKFCERLTAHCNSLNKTETSIQTFIYFTLNIEIVEQLIH